MGSLAPELLIVAFVLKTWLGIQPAPRPPLYQWFVGPQLVTYMAVPATYRSCRRFYIRTGLLFTPLYFVHANISAFRGLVSYLPRSAEPGPMRARATPSAVRSPAGLCPARATRGSLIDRQVLPNEIFPVALLGHPGSCLAAKCAPERGIIG